jgi:segregation and condensation protein B
MDPAESNPQFLRRVVEAALLASPQPLGVAQLAALFHDDERPLPGAIEAALDALRAECEGRGVELVEVASGYRFQVRADVHQYVARLWTERQVKYTRATLETLALIAYRQPITRGEIEQIRGVGVNANTIKMLEEREWIRVIGHRDVPGKPELFGTTRIFLDYFGLKNLDDLPSLAELKEIPELEPQLPFEPPVPAAAAMADELEVEQDDATDIDDAGEDEEEDAQRATTTNEEAGDEPEPELRNE